MEPLEAFVSTISPVDAMGGSGPPTLTLDPSWRGILILYNLFVVVLGIFGNLVVLIGSVKYGALNNDRTTAAFIENLALADIVISLSFYTPMLFTLIFEQWVLGDLECWLVAFFSSHVPFLAEILVIMLFSCYRVFVQKNSNRRKMVKESCAQAVIASLWVIAAIPIAYWIYKGCYAKYNPKTLSCMSSNHIPHESTHSSTQVFTVIYIVLPMVVVFCTSLKMTITLLTHVRNVNNELRSIYSRTIVAVNLICWAFLLSYLPIIVTIILKSANVTIPVWFGLLRTYTKSLHVVLNPFIYWFTNRGFRKWVYAWAWPCCRRHKKDTESGMVQDATGPLCYSQACSDSSPPPVTGTFKKIKNLVCSGLLCLRPHKADMAGIGNGRGPINTSRSPSLTIPNGLSRYRNGGDAGHLRLNGDSFQSSSYDSSTSTPV